MLRRCNDNLKAIEKDDCATGLRMNFSRGNTSSEFNRLFTSSSLREMVKGKDYCTLDMTFSFMEGLFIVQLYLLNKRQ